MKPNLSVISKIIFISLFIFTNTFSLWGSIFSINSVQAAPTLTTYVVPAISDHKILPKAPVETKYLSDRIDTHVAKDEYKALSFVVNSSENISDFQVEASDLTGQGGTISASNIDIRAVKVWYQSNFLASVTSTSGRYLTPELLLKDDSLVRVIGDDWTSWSASNPAGKNELKVNGAYQDISDGSVKVTDRTITPIVDRPIQDATSLQPLNLPANYNKQYWITLHIPQTANAGDYTATISLKNSTTTFKNLNLNVKVLSFVLPASDLEYSIYYRGRITGSGSISSEDKTAEQFAAEQANMAKHGLKNPTVYKPGTDEALLSELDLRRQNGIDNSNLYLLSLATSDVAKYKVLTAPYGVSNLYKYGPDEKDLNTITGRADIQAVHDAGGKYFNAQTSALADGVADVLDLAVVFQSPDKALAQKYHNYGNRVFSYANPQVGPEYPEIFRYNYGLLLWQNNYDGAMDYAYQDSAGDTWNDFDNTTHRDHNFTYPTANGVIDTVQWEGFREGINDTRYLKQLKISIAEAKTRGDKAALVSEAETYINNLKTALTQQNLVAARTQITNYIMGLDVNPQYHLTVNGGTGSGYYTLGTKVNIAANPAVAGATFAAWSGDTGSVQISGAPNTTVTIPDNAISLTATYIFNNWTEPTYSYKKTIAIDHTKVINSDQTNFPVLVSFTDPDLRTVANGGHVQNSNGYDMLFTLPDGTKLDYEVEKYDALTGQLIAWIKVPLLYTSQDTYLNLYYGNPNIVSSQANPTGVWTSSYKGVWHLNETDTGQVGDYKDSTANAFHSTNIIEQPTVTEGKITTGQAFTGATGREVIETSGTDGLNISNAITLSGWVKLDSFIGNAYEGLIYKKNNKDSIQSTAYGLTLDYSTSNVVLFASTDVKFGSTLKSRTQLQTGQ